MGGGRWRRWGSWRGGPQVSLSVCLSVSVWDEWTNRWSLDWLGVAYVLYSHG